MDGWMDGWMDEWVDGWMDGWMNGFTHRSDVHSDDVDRTRSDWTHAERIQALERLFGHTRVTHLSIFGADGHTRRENEHK